MKRIVNIIFVFILSFILLPKVNASSVSWTDITEVFESSLEEEYDATVTKTNNSLKAVIEDLDLFAEELELDGSLTSNTYTIELNYQNDVISLGNKDKSKFNTNDKIINGYLDTYLIMTLIELINENYEESEFDIYTSIEENTLSNYGIELVFEDLSTEDIEAFDISKFSINVNTFETAVKSNISNDEENPEVDGTIPDTDKDPVSNDENETNPSTGDTTVYIILSFLVLCIGLIIYKFKSLDNYNSL